MTAYSLRILAFPDCPLDQLERSDLDTRTVQSLALHAEACGPYGLQFWAKPRRHKLFYVDNCWVRASVKGSDLPAFFAEVIKGKVALDPDIDPDARYLIEAEEY